MHQSIRFRATVAVVLIPLHLTACTTWRASTLGPTQLIAEEAPSEARVTRTDGARVTIRDPAIRADSIVGQGGGVAVADVQSIEVRRLSVGNTIVATVFIGAAVVGGTVLLWLVSCGDSHRPNCPS